MHTFTTFSKLTNIPLSLMKCLRMSKKSIALPQKPVYKNCAHRHVQLAKCLPKKKSLMCPFEKGIHLINERTDPETMGH